MIKTEKTIRSSYSFYRANGGTNNSKTYIDIANSYMQFLMEQVSEGVEATLPARMGTLAVVGRVVEIKTLENGLKNLPPDWVRTKALWDRSPKAKANRTIVYHLNEHTSGTVYKVHWCKENMLVENKILYSLKIARTPARAISTLIKAGKEYFRKTSYYGKEPIIGNNSQN